MEVGLEGDDDGSPGSGGITPIADARVAGSKRRRKSLEGGWREVRRVVFLDGRGGERGHVSLVNIKAYEMHTQLITLSLIHSA